MNETFPNKTKYLFHADLNSKVRQYLEDHMHKTLSTRSGLINHAANRARKKNVLTVNKPKRKLSYVGSMRRTRSIQVENLEVPTASRGS